MHNARKLTHALAKKAALELNEDETQVDFYLNALRDWVMRQPHLKSRTDDQFLIVFLRAAKFSLEKAKQKLDNFYTYRAAAPEMFHNRSVEDPKVRIIFETGSLVYLPDPISEDGPRVIMIRPNRFDMNKHTIPDVFRIGGMATDVLMYLDDNAIISGYVLIMDLGNLPRSVVLNFDPTFARKVTILANRINPIRMKGFHFLNVPPVFEKLFNLVKSVINSKLRERFYVHSKTLTTLYEHIPRHLLPTEYGGDVDLTVTQKKLWENLMSYKHYLEEEENYGLSKDCAKAQKNKESAHNDLYGMQGTFRQLNVD